MTPRPDPFAHLDEWFAEAQATELQPEAAALATVGADGQPSNRIVLVRRWDERGFEVFTNLRSRKAREVEAHPAAAVVFHWKAAGHGGRQVRIEGAIEPMSDAESDAYWATRPRGSQISALASDQSQSVADRPTLLARRDALEGEYPEGVRVPRPEHWGGLRLVPVRFEFWQHEDDRFHQRLAYERRLGVWETTILQP
ncbi:MAG: pyridoxamine 5'-phosphate oxidase [Chloroflexi bacterium]|nr:pyridoxamine 5'-phosphate oxidase [Chloroflexota bacterium]